MDLAALLLTCQLLIGSVAIAVLLGCSAAVAISIAAAPSRAASMFWLAMLAACVLPLYLHAAAWEAAAGKFGALRWTQSAAATQPLSGLTAAIWIHGISGAAWVALATGFGLSRLPRPVVELASLDAGLLRRWLLILLPASRAWIAVGALGVATLAATEMTVVDLYAVRTLADEFYLLYAAQPSTAAVVRTLIPLLPIGVVLAVVLRRLAIGPAQGPLTTTSDEGVLRRLAAPAAASGDAPWWARALAGGWAVVVLLVMLAIPLASLVINAGQTMAVESLPGEPSVVIRSWSAARSLQSVLETRVLFAQEYRWTLAIALLMALVSTSTALLLVWGTRAQGTAPNWVDGLVLAAVMIPGPIVALAVVWLFRRDLPGFDLLYHQTLIPTALALLPRSGAAAYVTLRVAVARLDRSVTAAARLDCDSPWWRFWAIDRPRLAPALLVAAAIAAAVAVADVPATLPVIPPGVSTVGVRLFGLLHSGARQQEAALAIGFLLIVLVVVGIYTVARRIVSLRRPPAAPLR